MSTDVNVAERYLELARIKWENATGRDKRAAWGELRRAEDELTRANARAATKESQ